MENKTITIQTKLNKALGEMHNPNLDKMNPFHKSKYADLCGVLNAIKPALQKNELSLMQIPDFQESKITIKTVILDSENQIEYISTFPNTQTDPQKIGAVITYFRRYSLLTIFGLFGEEDDDANITIKQKEQLKQEIQPSEKIKELQKEVQKTPIKTIEGVKIEISKILNGMGFKKDKQKEQIDIALKELNIIVEDGMKLGIVPWEKLLEHFKTKEIDVKY